MATEITIVEIPQVPPHRVPAVDRHQIRRAQYLQALNAYLDPDNPFRGFNGADLEALGEKPIRPRRRLR
jgi:hypothetical protein